MSYFLLSISFFLGAYLLGCLPTAVFVCRLLHLPDPRNTGSQNPGATNVLRIGGSTAAILTLTGDLLKGFIPVCLAHQYSFPLFFLGYIGCASVLGHCYPVFQAFRGGKGVATGLGVLLALSWKTTLILMGIFVSIVTITGYVSLGSLTAAIVAPFLFYFIYPSFISLSALIMMSALIVLKHKTNIVKLRQGTETQLFYRPSWFRKHR